MRFSLQRYYPLTLCLLAILAFIFWSIAFYQSFAPSPAAATETAAKPNAITTVIIDAGHGGIDPGTSSADGLQEKAVNLRIAQTLQSLFWLNGYEVILTRDSDTDLSTPGKSIAARKTEDLKARLALFEQTENCIVLSIHQNHYDLPSSCGAQMFYGSHPLSETLAESIRESIVTGLQSENKRQCKPVSKDVYIIKHTTKPAVLCECGFLSNPDDAQNLADDSYCGKIAFCIYTGVANALAESDF